MHEEEPLVYLWLACALALLFTLSSIHGYQIGKLTEQIEQLEQEIQDEM